MRFPEFSGEWETKSINDLADVIGGGTPDTTVKSYWDGGIQWFTPSEIGKNKFVDASLRTITEDGLNNSSAKLLPPNTILLSSRATIGECSLSLRECATNQGFQSLVSKKCNVDFLYYLIQTKKKDLIRKSCGSTFLEISANEVRKIQVSVPSDVEQQKIAGLLSLIDKRIATQNKIIEDLKKLKSAIAETLFCTPKESMPAKRVSTYSKEWKLIKLSDICQRIQTKNTGNQCRQVLTIAAQHGLVNQEDFFNKTVASENLEGYYLLQKGDFAYNKSYSGDYTWGAIKRLERYDKGVLSPLYICFRPDLSKVDADFLAHYFESKKWYKGVADIAGEGARNHGLLNISVIDFFNTTHRIPNLDEQKRIAKILNSLSLKLSCEQRIMQSLMMQRNYLLRNMFI
ncbi:MULTISPECIES: restriction endonuclease subunit S [Bacteroidales]|uniref:restriction endonuclease subunit S n=1 Tax=Bacteroidales TaxID=171549 RepID=UPI001C377293|nr:MULTISPECIES: restriction endonuclease subunit S [Bacteroidales]MBV4323860.1 restriction endonuclease subunit S [Alistipes finegoldii]MBV4369337.1 restriction endonuclease subunit S [Alistipes finegoldii]MCZ2727031.1 restriction endonuclease subunit S [Bacteroides caccae]